jgi:fructose-1,6-bisphosphatase/inositol monophosphatase family enzyme
MRFDAAEVARQIAEVAAAEIMPRFGLLEAGDIQEKSPGDLVTAADIACEKRLTPILEGLLPGSVVVGEEAAAADTSVLARMTGEAPVWVIDPVDGTLNFASGIPIFGTMVALIRRGEVVGAWIHDPVRGRTLSSEAGSGTFMDGKRVRVAAGTDLKRMSGGFALTTGERDQAAALGRNADKIGSIVTMRCAAADYANLAEGRTHFAFFNRTYPWDHAPGWLLHKEAGGYSRSLKTGGAYEPAEIFGRLLLAPNEDSWHRLHEALWAA